MINDDKSTIREYKTLSGVRYSEAELCDMIIENDHKIRVLNDGVNILVSLCKTMKKEIKEIKERGEYV